MPAFCFCGTKILTWGRFVPSLLTLVPDTPFQLRSENWGGETMAWRIARDGLRRLAFLRPRWAEWGIKENLFSAFAGIAGVAVLISIAAWMILGQLGGMIQDLGARDIPRLTASLQLAGRSADLASHGPAVLSARDDADLATQSERVSTLHRDAVDKLRQLTELGADPAIVAALQENAKNIEDAIGSLGNAARERLELAARHQQLYEQIRAAQSAFLAAANPAMMAAQANINAVLASANLSIDDATDAARAVELQGNVVSSINQVSSDLMAALSAPSSDALEQIAASLEGAKQRAVSSLEALPDRSSTAALKSAAMTLLPLADGHDGVFKVRQRELDSTEYGQLILDEFRKLNAGLGISVQQLVDAVQNETEASSAKARRTVTIATPTMLALGALTLIGSALVVWLYVGRNILKRIGDLQHAMKRLSDGDLETSVTHTRQRDEIAVMADSLEVFRENMIRARTLSAEQDRDRLAKTERATRIEASIMEFEAGVRAALDRLQTSANTMEMTAQNMSSTADRSSALVSAVASAAEETSVNVQTVSSGTEQLASSILEISRQVASSTEIANKAVTEANKTDATVKTLAENANRISVVVDLIQTIAAQTNLLALNATIEAARAGEAGRGFAVVASEVKNLASQTARATDEIRMQITSMQDVTSTAVEAIQQIGATIGEINEVTTAIAAAVEEQDTATREIARNIQHAASGTSEVSNNILGVSQTSASAGAEAGNVLAASGTLRREAEILRNEIDTFLASIRAA